MRAPSKNPLHHFSPLSGQLVQNCCMLQPRLKYNEYNLYDFIRVAYYTFQKGHPGMGIWGRRAWKEQSVIWCWETSYWNRVHNKVTILLFFGLLWRTSNKNSWKWIILLYYRCRECNVFGSPLSLFCIVSYCCIVLYDGVYWFSLHCIVAQCWGLESGYCDRSHNRFYRPVSIWPPSIWVGRQTWVAGRKKNTDFNLLLTVPRPLYRFTQWLQSGR